LKRRSVFTKQSKNYFKFYRSILPAGFIFYFLYNYWENTISFQMNAYSCFQTPSSLQWSTSASSNRKR